MLIVKNNLSGLGGSPRLAFMGDHSCSKGCGCISQCHILDGHFSHWFVVKIVLIVWKDWKLSRSAIFDCEKWIPNKTHPTTFATFPLPLSGRVCFIQNCEIIKKLPPPFQAPPLDTCKSGPRPKIKNMIKQCCFAQQELSKMVWHDLVAPRTRELLPLRQKDWVQAKC